MKTKLKKSFKFGILIFGTSLFLWNCEKDNSIEQQTENTQSRLNIEMVSWNHLQSTSARTAQNINVFRKNNIAQRKIESSQYDFYIEDSRIQIIENDNFTTYTFFVVRDSPLPNILENYTYKAYNDGTYEQFLLKYHYTTHENGELIFDTDILEIETLNDESLIFNRSGCLPEFVNTLNDFACTQYTVCTGDEHHEVGDICYCDTTDPTCEPAGSLSCEYEYIYMDLPRLWRRK